ncbi:helix-turn-helix domain-containing protein [Metabacillus idriensis]|uniref:Helix-turn-helix domain-containing protein n=1 Tax=Metabacillus idriensis TaxID=324768 RepID=A0A6I2M3M7_9BACI|nr:AraC family transcriptional regulator [Metabacillus idriensis]MCM3595293.1 helix-turn-helix domain-containing protein [Metabacillus idriensis]MRX52680.1 helix-turn-helix domain-containing protein [Metabacillus idriensis]OHR72336.1 AraC family transcriptional regulator [Bacillus sp. HMSC76G11]
MTYIGFDIPPFPVFIKGGDAIFNKGTKHFKRVFTVFDLIYVQSGELYMTEHERSFTIREGQYLILIPGFEHYGHKSCGKDTRVFWTHFKMAGAFSLHDQGNENWSEVQTVDGDFVEPSRFHFKIPAFGECIHKDFVEKIFDNLVSMYHQTPDYPLRQQIYFEELILHLQKESLQIPSAAEKVVEETLRFLRKHYKEEIKMEDFARELHFHPDYITRCMQKTMGVTPVQYLNQYRMEQAKRLLRTADHKISSIAKEVGIFDAAYFTKVFKRLEGVSPLEYRKIVSRKK